MLEIENPATSVEKVTELTFWADNISSELVNIKTTLRLLWLHLPEAHTEKLKKKYKVLK